MRRSVCLIHGMSVGAWCWEKYLPLLRERGYECIAPVLPFHDAPPDAPPAPEVGTQSLLDYASFLQAEIEALPERPILIGHSMGGLLAQILAARGLAHAMVLLTPAAPAGILAAEWSVMKSVAGIFITPAFWRKPVRQTRRELEYSVVNLCPAAERRAVYERLVFESGRAVFETGFWFLDKSGASRVDAARVICPTLVVAGEYDRLTPPGLVRRVAQKYRDVATFRLFRDHSHWVLGEPGWQEVASYVADWLDAHAGPRP